MLIELGVVVFGVGVCFFDCFVHGGIDCELYLWVLILYCKLVRELDYYLRWVCKLFAWGGLWGGWQCFGVCAVRVLCCWLWLCDLDLFARGFGF